MPVVFVIATDWKLRTAVRAELRELGIDALGMDSPDDAGRTLARNQMPAAIVLESTAELVGNPAIQNLVKRVPTILIASRTETVPLPRNAVVLYRPVRIGDIVAKVRELLACDHAAQRGLSSSKAYELRSWKANYRGPLVIQAAMRVDSEDAKLK